MGLTELVSKAKKQGFRVTQVEGNKVKTCRGDIPVHFEESCSQPVCYPFGHNKRIELPLDASVSDLMHEKDHFEISPFDTITFLPLYLSMQGFLTHYFSKNISPLEGVVASLGCVILLYPIHNVFSDGIIYIRKLLGVNKESKIF